MQRITIKNFGPIRHLDLEIKDLSLFIGEQATGKSTVAKLIYFFKSLRGDLIDYLYDQSVVEGKLYNHFMYTRVNPKFARMLRDGKNKLTPSTIVFKYGENKYIRYQVDPNVLLPGFNFYDTENDTDDVLDRGKQTVTEIIKICHDIEGFRNHYFTKEVALLNSSESRLKEIAQKKDAYILIERINDFFGDDREILFIPASRSLLASLPEHLQGIETNDIDLLMLLFLRRISRLKLAFNQPLEQLIKERAHSGIQLQNEKVLVLAIQKIKAVLKGEYRSSDSGEEKIYFNDNKYVKLSMASSGQQEAVWILMQTFLLLLNREKVFLVIEEPEAHLSPEAQKSVVELITLLLKENDSQVLITTHSPYILTAFNNLIYAGNVGKEHAEEVGKIIPPQLWINSEQVGAYKLRGGTSEDLMDRETKLIRAEELDSVSQSINEAFDAILNLELQ